MFERESPAYPRSLTVDAIGGLLVLTLSGEIDAPCAEKLTACFDQAAGSGRPVIADLTSADELGPEAIEALRSGYGRLGTRLHLVAVRHEPAWAALRSAGVAHLFAVHSSRPVAMAAASARGASGSAD